MDIEEPQGPFRIGQMIFSDVQALQDVLAGVYASIETSDLEDEIPDSFINELKAMIDRRQDNG